MECTDCPRFKAFIAFADKPAKELCKFHIKRLCALR
jgi:hypothetical protein